MFQKFSFRFLAVLIVLICVGAAFAGQGGKTINNKNQAQNGNVWQLINDSQLQQRTAAERVIVPQFYKTFRLNKTVLREILQRAPEEFSGAARNSEIILTLPLPDGQFERFRIVEFSNMEPELAAKFPEIKSYLGQGIDDPTATTRFDLSPAGFRGLILSARGTILIDPYAKGDTDNYIGYYKRDVINDETFECATREDEGSPFNADYFKLEIPESPSVINGTQLRTYRLALAATGEYTNVFRQSGDTDAQAKTRALAQMNTTMNRVNGVYERDLAIRMVLVANTDLLIYTDSATDPYTNNNGGTMLGENQSNIDTVIGTANYDIGHVFSTGGGGVAFLRVPCGSSKAGGVTGLPNPVGDAFAIDYVAHEMGHQFGANHTFNGAVSNCSGGNRSAASAYEPGSGITIMAYAGICGNQNLAPNSIDTFHVKSLEVITAFVTNTGTCSVNTATNNTPPTVSSVGGTTFNIPRNTPFVLTATGNDADNDSINYDWQQYDLGGSTTAVPNADADGIARPLFRPYLPVANGVRYFPSLQYILNNANVPPATTGGRLTGELLPSISRTMNFQVIARDNRANGGGINTATVQVVVNGNSAPFQVLRPNSGIIGWKPNTTRTVLWDAGTTAAAPINAASVKISLSTDGGQTFPTVLANSTPNDGSETITVPSVTTTTARIKVEAVGNIFFDVSNVNFTISPTAVSFTPFDFDGDERADIAIFRPDNGAWVVRRSTLGDLIRQFGVAEDKPVAGDFDADGKADIAVFRPSTGTWLRLNSSDGTFAATQFGTNGDIPVIGDYDSDGKTDVSVFRPTNGTWYRSNSGNSQFVAIQFGTSGDIPTAGDYDGDGKTDVAVFRPSNGTWYRLNSGNGSFSLIQFGADDDVPTAADYDGDGRTDISVFRPTNGTWYRLNSTNGAFNLTQFGTSGDVPAPADYDGDGRADTVVFRSGTWYLLNSTTGFSSLQYGTAGDKPVSSSVVQ